MVPMLAAFRVVLLVPLDTIGTIIWQIISERYIFVNGNLFSNCTNGIPVVDILSNGNLYGTIANVYFISIIFHIADPCSLSYGQTIKRTSQLQYIRIYLEKCRDKKLHVYFQNRKTHCTSWWLQYSTYFIYHLNTNTQQNNNCVK